MPAWIIGSTPNAQINTLHTFSIYASIYTHKKEPLMFPDDWNLWQVNNYHSCARLTGYLSEWAVLEEKCGNQRFISQDISPVSFDGFFNHLVGWFGVEKGVVLMMDSDDDYPIVVTGKLRKESPIGYGPPRTTKMSFTLSEWAGKEGNHDAWKEIMEASGGRLRYDPFEDVEAGFGFGDAALRSGGLCLSMDKARRLGWTGFVDTVEGIFEMYREMGGWGWGVRWWLGRWERGVEMIGVGGL